MKRDKPDLLDWLGLRREFDFAKARWLGGLVSVAIALLLAVLLTSAIIEFVHASWSDDPDATALRNAGLVLAAMIGVPFLVWRSIVAQKQVDVAEQGQITDRINKAVEGLGTEKVVNRLGRIVTIGHGEGETSTVIEWQDEQQFPSELRDPSEITDVVHVGEWQTYNQTQPNLEVRIGSIYALERIAQDSDRDHVQVMEILCAYIRQNAPADLADPFPQAWRDALETEEGVPKAKPPSRDDLREWTDTLEPPREDIQVALTVLARRSRRQIALEGHVDSKGDWQGYRIDLRHTCLQRADLRKAAFDHADLNEARMQGADLSGAQMQRANLRWAQMQGAFLSEAQMQGADLSEAQMQWAYLSGAQMQWADLSGAQMQWANLHEAQMQWADLGEAQMQGANLHGAQMQGAYLSGAQMQWANLHEAQMQGADLGEAQMDSTTSLRAATLRGAALRDVDCSDVDISQDQIDSIFGDQTVILPEGLTRPDWPEIDEDGWLEFERQWRPWQKSIGFDPDDPATW